MTTPLMYAVQAAALWSGLLILMMLVLVLRGLTGTAMAAGVISASRSFGAKPSSRAATQLRAWAI